MVTVEQKVDHRACNRMEVLNQRAFVVQISFIDRAISIELNVPVYSPTLFVFGLDPDLEGLLISIVYDVQSVVTTTKSDLNKLLRYSAGNWLEINRENKT